MNQAVPHRGGAPVGLMQDLPALEKRAVVCLRMWHTGKRERHQICSDLDQLLGNDLARSAVEALEQICELCSCHARRPLMRHHVNCKCLGADEACFANFIGAAAEGEREDAMLIATLLIRHDLAPSLVYLAENLGLALKLATQHEQPCPHVTDPISKSLH